MRSAYDVLGIEPGAPREVVDQAYRDHRERAIATPPADPQAAAERDEHLAAVEWAWRTLSNETTRLEHDRALASGDASAMGGTLPGPGGPMWGPPPGHFEPTPPGTVTPPRARRGALPTVFVVIVLGAFLFFIGRVVLRAIDTVEREDGRIVERERIGPEHLRVGDCFNAPSAEAGEVVDVDQIEVVPCDQSHQNEVFDILELESTPDEDYPGDEAILQRALQSCVPGFEAFIGISVQRTQLDASAMFPNDESWDLGDRRVVCAAFDPAGEVTGTLRGAAR